MKDATPRTDDAREEFLTARQLAKILQVSESTVRRLARSGRIPTIRLTSRLMRFHLSSVREALDGAQRKGARREEPDSPQLSFSDLF